MKVYCPHCKAINPIDYPNGDYRCVKCGKYFKVKNGKAIN